MQIYLVGGAVRDRLLGLPVQDRDWVVVGATPEQMVAEGFQPVGRDFPVFLHPQTHEEYALARTERKHGYGYRGFTVCASPGITLEQDLARRDLTINAMAMPVQLIDGTSNVRVGEVIDPFGGMQDLKQRVLRHVTDAFREDPVRILRVARFAARFSDFSVAPQTLRLMHQMVDAGEVKHLVAERVWQEISRALMSPQPTRMVAVLSDCGALPVILPEVGANPCLALRRAAQQNAPLAVRYACWMLDLGRDRPYVEISDTNASDEVTDQSRAWCTQMGARLRVSAGCIDLADLALRESTLMREQPHWNAQQTVSLLERCDAFRKPKRFEQLLWVLDCNQLAEPHASANAGFLRQHLLSALAAAQSVDTAQVARSAMAVGAKGAEIGAWVSRARTQAVTLLTSTQVK